MAKKDKTGDSKDLSKSGPIRDRCKAHKKSGERCKNAPILGATVCRFHGGAAPQVKARAKVRLDMMAEDAVSALEVLMKESPEDAIQLRAALAVLDRVGLSPQHAVALTHSAPKFESLMTRIVREAPADEELDPAILALQESAEDDRY